MLQAQVFRRGLAAAALSLVFSAPPANAQTPPPKASSSHRNVSWPAYAGSSADDRYSPMTQINRSNVDRLHVAWTWDTGEKGGLQTEPLIVGDRIFVYTPSQKVVALNAATGAKLWEFNSGIPSDQPDRGFAFWTDGHAQILFADTSYDLWALNPDTGKPILSFGHKGSIDLRNNLGPSSPPGPVALTAPGVIYKNLIIVGFRTSETEPAPHGDIRAFDVHTGKMVWAFHTIPHPGDPGYDTWPRNAWKYSGSANNWTGMAVDQKRGIVYVPTGSAVSDFYGADRAGNDLFANCLLALDAATGKLIWYFQGVHHDIWDRDFPSPPVLVTVRHNGKMIPAVAQPTKQGYLYLFNRVDGKPLFPIVEKHYPASTTPGEWTSPTEPLPTMPAPYARQHVTADMLTERTPEAHAWAEKEFATFVNGGPFTPFRVDKPTVIFPGFDGGAEWGGSAVDPRTGVLYLNANDVVWTGSLTKVKAGGLGANTYNSQCAVCHGTDRRGQPPSFPSLVDATRTMTAEQMASVVHAGKGRMPAFPTIRGDELQALLAYVRTGKDTGGAQAAPPGTQLPDEPPPAPDRSDKQEMAPGAASIAAPRAPYQFTGYHKFLDPDGYPAVAPPWGTLNAIDLNTGKYLWKIPLGEYPELAAKGMNNTGSENYGGPIVTAGGLVFIGATNFDHKFRVFDSRTGKLLWQYTMEYAGNATPSTYMVDGKQYVVIATSNARNPKAPQGAKYVAFALR